jgi:3-dehydroquinate dehydratase
VSYFYLNNEEYRNKGMKNMQLLDRILGIGCKGFRMSLN